jgi:hypothetical protein
VEEAQVKLISIMRMGLQQSSLGLRYGVISVFELLQQALLVLPCTLLFAIF